MTEIPRTSPDIKKITEKTQEGKVPQKVPTIEIYYQKLEALRKKWIKNNTDLEFQIRETQKLREELAIEIRKENQFQTGVYYSHKEIDTPEDQALKNKYFQALGFSEEEYRSLSTDKNLKQLLNNSEVIETYKYNDNDKYDLYFYGKPFEENSIEINIRPTRFEDSINDYDKGDIENLSLEILNIRFYEPALLQVLQKNKKSSQNIFDKELTSFFEGIKKIKILEKYQREESKFFHKTIPYIHQEYAEKVKKSHKRFDVFLWQFLHNNKNISTKDFQKKLEKSIYIKIFIYNKNTFKFLEEIIKKYPKDIAPEERRKFVRLHDGKVEVSRTGDFKNDRVFFTIPIAFMDGNTYKFSYREKYEVKNIKKGTPLPITIWIEEKLNKNKKEASEN